MLTQVMRVASGLVESAASTMGLRFGTEEPKFLVEHTIGDVQIRRYQARIAAQTAVTDSEERARSAGFRRLARYIFGGNHAETTIAMTAPVSESRGTAIAMTAPVSQALSEDGAWIIRFFMPAKWSLESLPTPDDPAVQLVTVPAERVAVLRFSGDRGARAVAAKSAELVDAVAGAGLTVSGAPVAWFYDPPWTLPFRRRNEVAVSLQSD